MLVNQHRDVTECEKKSERGDGPSSLACCNYWERGGKKFQKKTRGTTGEETPTSGKGIRNQRGGAEKGGKMSYVIKKTGELSLSGGGIHASMAGRRKGKGNGRRPERVQQGKLPKVREIV